MSPYESKTLWDAYGLRPDDQSQRGKTDQPMLTRIITCNMRQARREVPRRSLFHNVSAVVMVRQRLRE